MLASHIVRQGRESAKSAPRAALPQLKPSTEAAIAAKMELVGEDGLREILEAASSVGVSAGVVVETEEREGEVKDAEPEIKKE